MNHYADHPDAEPALVVCGIEFRFCRTDADGQHWYKSQALPDVDIIINDDDDREDPNESQRVHVMPSLSSFHTDTDAALLDTIERAASMIRAFREHATQSK